MFVGHYGQHLSAQHHQGHVKDVLRRKYTRFAAALLRSHLWFQITAHGWAKAANLAVRPLVESDFLVLPPALFRSCEFEAPYMRCSLDDNMGAEDANTNWSYAERLTMIEGCLAEASTVETLCWHLDQRSAPQHVSVTLLRVVLYRFR